MKCRYCGKIISFSDWLCCRRLCVDHWMRGFELPRIDKWISKPKNKIKFENWKNKKLLISEENRR